MASDRIIRWGVLGCAAIAKKDIPAIKAAPHSTCRAVASRDVAKANSFAKEFEIPVAYGSYEELLTDKDIDAVYIPLPTFLHKEWTIKAARAGKHVICEKPMTPKLADLKEMMAECEKHKVLLMDGVMWTHHSRTAKVLEILAQSKATPKSGIGSPLHVASEFHIRLERSAEDIRVEAHKEPHGCLGDLGWYNITATLTVFDLELPQRVQGTARREEGVIMHFMGQMWFSGGRTAQFSCSFNTPLCQEFKVLGSEGALTVPDFVWPSAPEVTYVVQRGKDDIQTNKVSIERGDPFPYRPYGLYCDFVDLVLAGKVGSDNRWTQLMLKTQTILDALLRSDGLGAAAVDLQ